ncbi:OTU domain-containing protein [Tanacetum coccineum]|uniref:OTU domain-containing protein n=1 Tax=Tanacetum coccineum TaxID=301880 RepID=A0ABQ5IEA1_9ASTR
MSRDKTWGDIITLYAATNVFRVRTSIISSFVDNVVRELVPECMEYKKDIYLSYVYFSEDDTHYDVLVHRYDLPSLQRSRSLSPVRRRVRENFEVVVDNIPHSWRSYDLRVAFEECAAIANSRVIYTRHGGSRGFGYVEIEYERDVDRSVAIMYGSVTLEITAVCFMVLLDMQLEHRHGEEYLTFVEDKQSEIHYPLDLYLPFKYVASANKLFLMRFACYFPISLIAY